MVTTNDQSNINAIINQEEAEGHEHVMNTKIHVKFDRHLNFP